MVSVESRIPGRQAALTPTFAFPLPPQADAGLPLRELIALTVRHEIEAYEARRAEASLARVLTERDLSALLGTGAARPGERERPPAPPAEFAVTTAIEAFTDGLFLVVVDGQQHTDLDAIVPLTQQSHVTYLRLVALTGG